MSKLLDKVALAAKKPKSNSDSPKVSTKDKNQTPPIRSGTAIGVGRIKSFPRTAVATAPTWVEVDMSSGSIVSGNNVASVVVTSPGIVDQIVVTFTNAVTGGYGVVFGGRFSTGSTPGDVRAYVFGNKTTSGFTARVSNSGVGIARPDFLTIMLTDGG